MSGYAFRCDKTGLVEFADSPGEHTCPYCHGTHETYSCGTLPMEKGAPNIVGDKLHKHFDWQVGQEIDSRSQRKRVYKSKGLVEASYSEHCRQFGVDKVRLGGISYAGQPDRRSSREREPVRTKDGRPVI